MRRGLRFAAVAVGVVTLVAQAQNPQTPPVFRAGINLVQTDVTVLGPDGRPVHGLTMDDFSLFEDGEAVPIRGFAEVSIPDTSEGPPWLRDSSPDVRSAMNGRVFVFLLDDAQVPFMRELGTGFVDPTERIAAVKRITEQFINRMGPDDMAAVLCTYDKRCDQDFTSDRGRIRAAVARFVPKTIQAGASGYKVSANMAESIARLLTGQASRRRTIVYISPRLPMRPAVGPPHTLDETQVVATFKAAMRAGITVYGVNPTSLLSLKDAPPDDPNAPEPDRTSRFATPPRSLATETGGFIVWRPDQFADGVAQIFRETGSYYLLGYEPPPKKDTGYNMIGGLREIEVRVNRPDLTIRTHRGYVTTPEPKTPKNPPAESTKALAGVLPKTDLPLRINIVPMPEHGRSDSVVAIALAIDEPAPDSRMGERFDVQIRAFTPHGNQRAEIRLPIDTVLRPTRTGVAVTEVVSELRLDPGVYEIRASAYSEALGVAGSIFADVEVPNINKVGLALSGILLTSSPGPDPIIPTALSPMLPLVPTTQREFTRSSLVRAQMRMYQNDTKHLSLVTIKTSMLDEHNVVAFDRSEVLAAERFGTEGTADWPIEVPLLSLAPGTYRLRVEATASGVSVHRDVQFVIK